MNGIAVNIKNKLLNIVGPKEEVHLCKNVEILKL